MTRPTTTGKAQDLITFTRSTTGTALAKISYGEELVTNGDFSSDVSGWTLAYVTASHTPDGIKLQGNGYAYQSVPTVAGKRYVLTGNVTAFNNGNSVADYEFRVGTSTYPPNLYDGPSQTGVRALYAEFTATTTTSFIVLKTHGTTGGTQTVTWDNISVKEVSFDQPDGTLQLFNHPINKPRIEYDASGNCLGLLVEEARTNKVTYSEDFTHSSWLKQEVTVAPAPVVAPDGTMTATHVVKTGSNAHLVATNIGSTADRSSIWARTVSGTGTMYLGGTDASTLVTVTEEWQKLDAQAVNPHMYAANLRGIATLTEVYVWGAQLETGSFPTSYIPTSGSTVTRAADVASLAVSEFGYNQDQFSVVVESDFFGTDSAISTLCYIGESNDDRVLLYYNSQDVNYQVKSAGSSQAQRVVAGYVSKSAYRYKLNDMVLAGDGNISTTDTAANLLGGTQNNIYIGGYFNGSATLNGHIKSIKYYPVGLSNAQLQALTV